MSNRDMSCDHPNEGSCRQRSLQVSAALFDPKTSILIQKRHPYTENLNSETSGDSKNAFLHCGDVLF